MDFFKGMASEVKVLLGSNDVHVFPVVYNFANERNVLQTENRNVFFLDFLRSTEGELSLPVECSLSEDRTDEAAWFYEVSNLFQNL